MGLVRKSIGILAAVVCCSASAAFAQEVDNPMYKSWAKFKPGTSVTVKTESDMAGNKSEMENTTTLLELTAEKAVVENKMSMVAGGQKMDMPAQKMEVKAKSPKMEGAAPAGTMPAVKESSEEIEVAGKKVKCKVIESTTEMSGMKTTSKTWVSEEVPGGTVKMESATDGAMKGTTKMNVTAMTIK